MKGHGCEGEGGREVKPWCGLSQPSQPSILLVREAGQPHTGGEGGRRKRTDEARRQGGEQEEEMKGDGRWTEETDRKKDTIRKIEGRHRERKMKVDEPEGRTSIGMTGERRRKRKRKKSRKK